MFLINIKFHLDFSKIGYLTGLLSRPDTEKLPSKFTIRVNRLAQAGYKVGAMIKSQYFSPTTIYNPTCYR